MATKFDCAFEEVKALVNTFKSNERHYLSNDYQEAQARIDFINKFFNALGWDVNHDSQKDPYQQEVKVEITQSNQKRPDYSFYLNPDFKNPKFFVEAKKPAKNLRDKDFYFQTMKYAWNAGTPVAILTDFQEFHILDCRFKPNINYAFNASHLQFDYSQYADKEVFGKIYYLLSRESVADNSLERYSKDLPKPTGKAVQRGLFRPETKPIDDDILEFIDSMRETLAKALKTNDEKLDSEQLTEAVQRIVDRLVFIRFLEDKQIEPEYYISELGAGGNAWKDFIALCRRLDAKYNGIVFKKHFIDEQNFKGPQLSDFADICEEICHKNSVYAFNMIPIHILGSIYERFLGKIVHATDKRVKVEEKPEVRKAGGVYYTPKYIVDYIVKNTVGELIKDKTPAEIAKLKMADIACGSGSFLIGAFECLLDYHHTWYQKDLEAAKKAGCHVKEGQVVLSIKQKQAILLNNIFGVDIDSQAVEVTQLSLALKMLEDETTATANDMQVLFHEKIVPNLSGNVVCGNSLIGTDILNNNDLFTSVEDKKEIELKIKPMDFEEVFPEVFKKGGFDCVIGNPPYGAEFRDNENKYFENSYDTYEYQLNSFSLFIEKGINLLNKNGCISFITPAVFLTQHYFSKIRQYILHNNDLSKVLLINYKVFDDANTGDTSIFVVVKSKITNKTVYYSIIKNKEEFNSLKYLEKHQSEFINNQRNEINLLINKVLFDKFINKSVQLGEIANCIMGIKPYQKGKGAPKQSATIVNDRVFDSNKKISDEYKRYLIGKDIDRYIIKPIKNRYIKYGKWLAEPRFTAPFEKVKIILRQTSDIIRAVIDDAHYYNLNNVYNVEILEQKYDYKYILGILNSKLMVYIYQTIVPEKGRLFAEIKKVNLDKIPIRDIDFTNISDEFMCKKLISLVDQMLSAKKELHEAKTDKDKDYYERRCKELDNQIDRLVYELYGLTEEEIKIIEDSVK